MTRDEIADAACGLITAVIHRDVAGVRAVLGPMEPRDLRLLAARLAAVTGQLLDDLAEVEGDPLRPTGDELWQHWLLNRATTMTGEPDG